MNYHTNRSLQNWCVEAVGNKCKIIEELVMFLRTPPSGLLFSAASIADVAVFAIISRVSPRYLGFNLII